MNVSASIPATVQIKRSHLVALMAVVAAVAAAMTSAVFALAFATGDETRARSGDATSVSTLGPQEQRALEQVNSLRGRDLRGARYYWTPSVFARLGAKEQGALDLVTSMTPAQLRAIRYYWTPTASAAPTDSGFDPSFAQFVRGITSLAQAQQAAGSGR